MTTKPCCTSPNEQFKAQVVGATGFASSGDQPSTQNVVTLSSDLWQRVLTALQAGGHLANGTPFQVCGVALESYAHGCRALFGELEASYRKENSKNDLPAEETPNKCSVLVPDYVWSAIGDTLNEGANPHNYNSHIRHCRATIDLVCDAVANQIKRADGSEMKVVVRP